jgi:tripartite-type tricarboxylate transporter receptor subunit TctC
MIGKLASAVALVVALAAGAQAQEYPTRLIKIVQGFAPGGNVDIIARILAQQLQPSLGQSIIVEAKPGAAGSLAADMIARSEPDGHTLLVLPSAHPMHGGLAKNVKYDVVDGFTWVSTASFYPFLICVRSDSRFRTLQQLIEEAHAKPGTLKYASSGPGTGLHTIVELIAHRTKSKFMHVPYRGEGHATTALLAGEVDFIAVTTGPISPRIRVGEFRALAVTSKTRWHEFPDVPTAEEAGVPGFEFVSWTGLAGPPNLPASIVRRLNSEIRKAIAIPEVKTRLEVLGGAPRASTPEEMKALVAKQYEAWKKLAKETNIRIN